MGNKVERLLSIAVTQPHAAYTAFTHGLKHKWTYLMITIPNIDDQLQLLEDVIRHKFLPSHLNLSGVVDTSLEIRVESQTIREESLRALSRPTASWREAPRVEAFPHQGG